jgi:hydroxyacylglutathione hydrolase
MSDALPSTITPVRAFADNYIWIISMPGQQQVAIVDPGDARPVLDWLQQHSLQPGAILITHFHSDHTGGIAGITAAWPDIPVYGPAGEPANGVTTRQHEAEVVKLPFLPQIEFTVMEVPGHTAGHIAYYGNGVLFCGDTLFAAGCGRVFTGTFPDLAASLQRIAKLPPDTRLYCAHEYTVDNIGFAKWVEPDNQALLQRDAEALEKAEKGLPTVPSTLALELATNPFMRLQEPTVIAAAQAHMSKPAADLVSVFTALRQWKDREYD